MTNEGHVEVRELRAALDRILDAVEAGHGPTIDLRADYYATLDLRLSFDPTADQSAGMTMGQLTDDVQELRALLTRTDAPVVWHDLAHVVGILRRVAALDLPGGASA
jgi:hypothetical protein